MDVHTFHYADLCDRYQTTRNQLFVYAKSQNYRIECREEDGQVPDFVRAVAGSVTAVHTEGWQSACAVHAVFGRPSTNGKLTAPNARGRQKHLAEVRSARVPPSAVSSGSIRRNQNDAEKISMALPAG